MERGRIGVEYEEHFGAYARAVEQATRRALEQAGRAAVAAAHETSSPYRTEAITGAVHASAIESTSKGQGIWLIAPDWRSLFFQWGTYRRRTKRVKRPGPRYKQQLGVQPLRFLSRALDTGRRTLFERLAEEIGRVRV